MKIVFLYYDNFAQFEISCACLLLCEHDLVFCGLEEKIYKSQEKQSFKIDCLLRDINPQTVDLFVIPGGSPLELVQNNELKNFLQNLVLYDKKIAGICGGSELLAALGFLKNIKCTGGASGIKETDPSFNWYDDSILLEENVVVDQNIITSQGQAYAEFATELASQCGMFSNDVEKFKTLHWLKNDRTE